MALVVKNPPANSGDMGSIPGLGRSPGKVNGNLLQYFCLKNPMDRGTWSAVVHGVAESGTTEHAQIHTREGKSCSQTHKWVTSHKKVTLRGCTGSSE